MRRVIKRLLKNYDYPPEQAKQSLLIVMRQAEKVAGNIYDEVEWTSVIKKRTSSVIIMGGDIVDNYHIILA